MATLSEVSTSPLDRAVSGPSRAAIRVRAALVVLIVATWLLGCVLGEVPSNLTALRAGLLGGRVTEVTIAHHDPPGAPIDYVDISWREGWWIAQHVQVASVVRPEEVEPVEFGTIPMPTVDGPVEDRLRELQPGVTIRQAEPQRAWATLFGLRTPLWLLLPVAIGSLAIVSLLISGREPRFATRWAWFWLLCMGPLTPIVSILFLLQGMTARPEDGRRLTGGWAFLILVFAPKPF